MFSGSTLSRAPALIVNQVGGPDHATGAVTYQATVTGRSSRAITLSFTAPRDGLVTDLGDGMFRYTPVPQVNPRSDSFTVIARDGRGRRLDSSVTWINDEHGPVAVAPPTLWPPDPVTGAVTVSPNIVAPDGDSLTYTVDAPYPRRGEVTIGRDGTFTYVPFPSERKRSATESETLGFRAVDPRAASAYITVTVPITPRDGAPTRNQCAPMRGPDPATGVVSGGCREAAAGSTYGASTPARGVVVLDPATGSWAYRPTPAARHRAVADHAGVDDRYDSFTITVTDRRGATTVVPVTVPLVSMKTVPSYAVTAQIPVGVAPADLALGPGGDQVYVTSVVDDAVVTVVRTADNSTSTIPLDFSPHGVVVASDGGHLYVTDPIGNRVAVIDPEDHSAVFVAVGQRPFCMAFLGTDLYVANNEDGTVSMIDTVHNAVVRTIAVGGHPYAVAAWGAHVYVTDYGFYGGQSTHSISVIDAAGGHVIDEVPVGYYPTGITVSPDGGRVYVTNDEGSYTSMHPGTTTVIDTATLEVVDTLPVGGVSIAVDDDGSHAYVVSHTYTEQFTSTLAVVDVATGHVDRVSVNGMPNALATNGDRIYLTDTWHSAVQQLTARQTSVVDTDAVNDPPTLTISRTGDYEYQATVVDPDGDTVTYTATQPFSGTVTDLGGGRFQYTPNARADEGFVDHFAITADDGHGGVVTKTVSATVY